jgi:hypothetical protein
MAITVKLLFQPKEQLKLLILASFGLTLLLERCHLRKAFLVLFCFVNLLRVCPAASAATASTGAWKIENDVGESRGQNRIQLEEEKQMERTNPVSE